MISLLSKLIALPSPSREEAAAASFLEQELRLRGADVHRHGNNLWCAFGDGPAVLMDAHIDTVRPVDGWVRDPFTPSPSTARQPRPYDQRVARRPPENFSNPPLSMTFAPVSATAA